MSGGNGNWKGASARALIWIPVSVRMPSHGKAVLITDGTTVTAAEHFVRATEEQSPWSAHRTNEYMNGDWSFRDRITHWALYPEPPAAIPPKTSPVAAEVGGSSAWAS